MIIACNSWTWHLILECLYYYLYAMMLRGGQEEQCLLPSLWCFQDKWWSSIRVTSPITTLSLVTSLDLHHLCFILSDLKWYWSSTSSYRNHLFEVQMKRSNEKNKKKKISFSTHKRFLFLFFLLFGPLLLSYLLTLSFLVYFKRFKMV